MTTPQPPRASCTIVLPFYSQKEFRKNFMLFNLCLLPLVLLAGTTGKSLALSSSLPPIRYFYTLIDPPGPSHVQAEQSQLTASPHMKDTPIS